MGLVGKSRDQAPPVSHLAIVHLIYMNGQTIPSVYTPQTSVPSVINGHRAVFRLWTLDSAIVWDYANKTYCHVRPSGQHCESSLSRMEVSKGIFQSG